ncbi:hypothetical protein BT69DRAFT_1298256 [Atractiella rhizophila]|nr:hypothetical protein BT69DRAFT_1298256 [Atractiella rhizophila]
MSVESVGQYFPYIPASSERVNLHDSLLILSGSSDGSQNSEKVTPYAGAKPVPLVSPQVSSYQRVLDMNGVEYFPSSSDGLVKRWFPTSNASLSYSDEVEGKPVSAKISTLKINRFQAPKFHYQIFLSQNRFLLRFFLPQLFVHMCLRKFGAITSAIVHSTFITISSGYNTSEISVVLFSDPILWHISPRSASGIVKSFGHYLPTLVVIGTDQNGGSSKPGGRNSPASK